MVSIIYSLQKTLTEHAVEHLPRIWLTAQEMNMASDLSPKVICVGTGILPLQEKVVSSPMIETLNEGFSIQAVEHLPRNWLAANVAIASDMRPKLVPVCTGILSLQEKVLSSPLIETVSEGLPIHAVEHLPRNWQAAKKVAIAPDMRPKLEDSRFLGLLPRGHL